MSNYYKKKISKKDVPDMFCEETIKRLARIESSHSVIGVLYLEKEEMKMYTVPETTAQMLSKKLPILNTAMHQALTEIDVQNELIAYRIQTRSVEIAVVANQEFAAAVLHNVKKSRHTALRKKI